MNMMTTAWDEQAESLWYEPLVGLEIVEAPKPLPPAWLIAPNFRAAEEIVVREPQVAYHATPVEPLVETRGPYRSVGEVKRFA
jgi:hypothetical protein